MMQKIGMPATRVEQQVHSSASPSLPDDQAWEVSLCPVIVLSVCELHTAWQNTRRATIKHRVQLAVTRQTINRIEQQAQTPSAFFKQVLPVHPPMPDTLPFRDAARNKVWLAIVSDLKVDANLLASIDML